MNAAFIFQTPGLGKAYSVAGDRYVIMASGAQTGGAYCVANAFVPPGGGPVPHYHTREEESFYVLEGEITFTVDGREIIGRAGTFVQVPRHALHAFRNESAAPARMLIMCIPAGFDEFIAEVATELPSADAPPWPPSAAEIEKLIAIAPKYGIVIQPPPP